MCIPRWGVNDAETGETLAEGAPISHEASVSTPQSDEIRKCGRGKNVVGGGAADARGRDSRKQTPEAVLGRGSTLGESNAKLMTMEL